jgi:hypothetical protein
MAIHLKYEGNATVRILPPGVSGEKDSRSDSFLFGNGRRSTMKPPPGYQHAQQAADRLGISLTSLYKFTKHKKLSHLRIVWGKTYRVFIPVDATVEEP